MWRTAGHQRERERERERERQEYQEEMYICKNFINISNDMQNTQGQKKKKKYRLA
jgi:hypothetical protein